MLYSVGPLIVSVYPFNADRVSRKSEATFVEKPVLGRRPPLEAVGEGSETFSLSGKLFPLKLGGLSELELADQIRASQEPVFVMRGDGYPLGYFVLESIDENGSYLAGDGVPQVVEYQLNLRKSDAPGAGAAAGSLFSISVGVSIGPVSLGGSFSL